MAVEKLTNTGVRGYAPQKKRYSVRDSEIQGLVLRVEPSGKKTFYLDYREKTPLPQSLSTSSKTTTRTAAVSPPSITRLMLWRVSCQRFW